MSKHEMITPENAALVLIDFQPAMYQGVESHDRLSVMHNVQILAKGAKLFGLPVVISTVAQDSFSGPFMPEVTELYPDTQVIDRTSINSWVDANFREAVAATGRKKIVLAGLWTEACVMFPTLDLLREQAAASNAALLVVTHDHGLLDRFDRVVDFADFRTSADELSAEDAPPTPAMNG